MSRLPTRQVDFPFGGPSVVPAAPTPSNSESLLRIFQAIGTAAQIGVGAATAEAQSELDDAQALQTIQRAEATEEIARVQEEREKLKLATVRQRFAVGEARDNYDDLVKITRDKVAGHMATLSDEELVSFLKDNPIFKDENRLLDSEFLGSRLAASQIQEAMAASRSALIEGVDAARGNPAELRRLEETGSLAGFELSEHLGELAEEMAQLPTRVYDSWSRVITRMGLSAVRAAVKAEASQQQREVENESDQELLASVYSVLSGDTPASAIAEPDGLVRQRMEQWAAVRNVSVDQAEEHAASRMRESLLKRLSGPEDPQDLLDVIESIDHRSSFWRRLETSPLGSVEGIAKAAVTSRALADATAQRDRIVRLSQDHRRGRNPEGLERELLRAKAIEDPSIREEAVAQAESMIIDLKIVDRNVTAASVYVATPAGKRVGERPSLSLSDADGLLDRLQSVNGKSYDEALESIADVYQIVPPQASRRIEDQLSSASRDRDVPGGLAGLRAIGKGNPFLADQLSEGVGLFGRMAWRVTRNVDPESDRYFQIIKSLQGPNARTGSGLAARLLRGLEDAGGGLTPFGIQAAKTDPAARADIFRQFTATSGPYGILRKVFPSPDASVVRGFEDHFRLAVIENLDAGIPQDEVGEAAANDATERLRGDKPGVTINRRPYYMERGEFTPFQNPIDDRRDLIWVSGALSEWETEIQQEQDDVFVRPDRSVTILGKRYVGAIGVDVDPLRPGVGLAAIMEVSVGGRKITELSRGTDPVLFDKVEGLMLWDMSVDDADRFARFRWKPEYGEKTVTAAAGRLGDVWVNDLREELELTWEDEHGDEPSMSDPEFIEWAMDKIRSWGWTGSTR